MGLICTGYINLTDKEKLYAMRSVFEVWKPRFWPTSAYLGISRRALKSLEADGLVEQMAEDMWGLTENGARVVSMAGGFKHG